MSDANKALVRRWFNEVWNQGRIDTIDELLAPNALIHGLDTANGATGPAAFKPFHTAFRNAFPNIHIEILHAIAEGDYVSAHCRVTGVHQGALQNIQPTQRTIQFAGIAIARIQNGKIVEGWNHFDFMNLYKQIGITTIV